MSVHVLVWFSVIWVLVLSQGNTVDKHGSTENGLDVSDVVLPGQPINRCDTRCFAKVRFLFNVFERINEPPHGKTNNLHRRKQRRRSASR